MTARLLSVENLTKMYGRKGREIVAVSDFSLHLPETPASIVTIAGESGSGKSTIARLVLGLERPTAGRVLYRGRDVATLDRADRHRYRREVQAVFQDPYASYNPYYKVGHIYDVVLANFKLAATKAQGRELVEEALATVGLRGTDVLDSYPHQLSGGQRQRMMIARAYMLKPRLIVADEPVSMVDATLRAMILEIMRDLRDHHGISFIYITHDLSTAYAYTDSLYVLYRGVTTEVGPTQEVIDHPHHPYAESLVSAIPRIKTRWEGRVEPFDDSESGIDPRTQCPYAPRCPHVMDRCIRTVPPSFEVAPDHGAACFLHEV